MKKRWLLVVGLVLVLGIVGLTSCESGSASLGEITALNFSNQQQGIWVTGQGKAMADADIATLRLGIEAEEASVAEAQTQAVNAMDEVMTALTRNGVANKDIQVQQFSIRRVTKWDREKEEEVLTGYRVTHMVTAKIRDIDKAGTIIDAAAKAGGDLTRIDSINFSVEDPTNYYKEAREEAMADAEAKAKQLANLAGVTLGKATYISESLYTPPIVPVPRVAYEIEEAVAETSISPGELEISLNLQVAYAIK
ncbi:26 kDa periplasmic immunogenic protein [subsurface metagenome]